MNVQADSDRAEPVSSDNFHMIVISPAYITNNHFFIELFPGSVPSEASQFSQGFPFSDNDANLRPYHMTDGSQIQVTDLSRLDNQTFNLALFASRAHCALLIVDATFGSERRILWAKTLACLARIPHLILAIDNMETTGWSQERFESIKEQIHDYGANFCHSEITCIPVDIASRENIHSLTNKASWYEGPYLTGGLEAIKNQFAEQITDTSGDQSSNQFSVFLCAASKQPLLPSRHYKLIRGDQTADAQISSLKYRLNPETLDHLAAKKLYNGNIGYCNLSLDKPVDFDPFEQNRLTGDFYLQDKATGENVAYGLIRHSLRRATNIKWHTLSVDKAIRGEAKGQKPCVLWFTGLSGSGKSTIATILDKKLHAIKKHTYVLDGDNVRHGLCRDLGFTDSDRVENLRRISETAKLFADAGLITLVSFISPFRSERRAARNMFDQGEFLEVFVDTPLEVCEQRDPKNLYKKARAGDLKNFTGIDSPYEPPENAEIVLAADKKTPEQLAEDVLEILIDLKMVKI